MGFFLLTIMDLCVCWYKGFVFQFANNLSTTFLYEISINILVREEKKELGKPQVRLEIVLIINSRTNYQTNANINIKVKSIAVNGEDIMEVKIYFKCLFWGNIYWNCGANLYWKVMKRQQRDWCDVPRMEIFRTKLHNNLL